MLTPLIERALVHRALVLVFAAGLAIAGWRAFQQLPIDAFPDVSPAQVKVIIKAPGLTPEEVETLITAPIEVELLGIPRQVMLRSISKYALTDITLDFAEGTDIYWARQQVADRLAGVWDRLPTDIDGGIAPLTTPLGEMFMFTITGDLDLMQRRHLLDWVIRPALRTVPGVADVNALGGLVRSFTVIPDPQRMAARRVDLDSLLQAINANNRNDGAGRLREGEETLLVRVEGRIETLDDLRQTVVRRDGPVAITVDDVATVRIEALTRYGAVTENGVGETVQGLVLGLRGANARAVVRGVRARLAALQPSLPEGVRIEVFYDRGELVQRAVGTVSAALAAAMILVTALLVLFLGRLRAAITVALVLPLAALATFLLMRLTGMSANLMSLGGLAVAIGLLVDPAVVVVENIANRSAGQGRGTAAPRLNVVYRATREVALPVTAGTAIIIIVFMPLLTLQGLEGTLFSPVALTIVFALGSALLLSLTVIPALASWLIPPRAAAEPWIARQLHRVYEPLLRRCLHHPLPVAIVAVAVFVAALAVLPFIGRTFMPTMDEGDLLLQTERLPSITLEESVAADLRLQRAILAAVPEVIRLVARVGSDELGLDPMGLNEADLFMVLRPPNEWRPGGKAALADAIREVLDGFPGLAYGFTQPIEMRVAEMLTGVRGDVAVKVFGPDLEVLNDLAERIADVLHDVPGASDVFARQNEGVQYLALRLDRQAAGRLGLSGDAIQRNLRAALEGVQGGVVQEGIARTPLLLRAGERLRSSPELLGSLPVVLPDGNSVPLASVAQIERTEGVVAVQREQGQRFTVVRSNVSGRDLVGFVEAAQAAVSAQVTLPPGYRVEWGGEYENQQRAAARLALVVPAGLAAIFLILLATFGTVRQALLVLANVPFAVIGGILALWVTGEYLSVPASVGFIALLGIAVMNGIVLVTHFNELAAQGLRGTELVVQGASRRLRPVLMTATTSAFGLMPLLFASGPGSEIQRPLAIVVIGGLVSATVLTLILLPLLYQRWGNPEVTAS